MHGVFFEIGKSWQSSERFWMSARRLFARSQGQAWSLNMGTRRGSRYAQDNDDRKSRHKDSASVRMALQREFLAFPYRIFALSQISTNLPVHAGGFFFGLCRARRRPVGVAGVAFELTFFGAFIAAGGEPKRAAHFCSKRL
jgi:hypothetical protein